MSLTKKIYSLKELDLESVESADQSLWTAIIPAAGRGSRLGFELPKILYPINGKTILEHLFHLLNPFCQKIVLVVAPQGQAVIEAKVNEVLPQERFIIVQQPEPTGMADAVLRGAQHVTTPYSLVIWGDQIALKSETISGCLKLHQNSANVKLTLPTVIRAQPYIHIVRDPSERIVRVLQAREKEIDVEYGENDCGLFLFDNQFMFRTLKDEQAKGYKPGQQTGEFNLLPLLPLFDENGSARTLRLEDASETLGINTKEEVKIVEQILANRENSNGFN